MVFYEIELLGATDIKFACSVNVESCKNRFDSINNFFEICLIEEGRIIHKHFDGTSSIALPNTISTILSDAKCEIYSAEGERQRHTTVGVYVPYKLKRYESEYHCNISALKEKMKEKTILLIPNACTLDEYFQKSIDLIKSISYHKFSQTGSGNIKAIGKWYSLVGLLTDFVLKKLDKINNEALPSEITYSKKAKDYIVANYYQKICISDIADFLGISSGHLHRIFKNAVGMTIVEYINRCKIDAALSLMESRGLSLKDASLNVGIDDPSYMSRMFKKITGMNPRSYLKQKSETLRKLQY